MKKKLNWTRIQLKLEKFIFEELWQYLLVIAFVSFYAWIFNKWWQSAMFLISHTVIRPRFNKQYHCSKTYKCMIMTLSIALFALYLILPMEVSLLSTLPITYMICWVGEIAQDRVDYMTLCKRLQKELDEALSLDIYKMTEDELRRYGASKHLSEVQIDILVMRVMENLKISEICKYRNYGRTTIKYHIAQIKQKLQIDKI